jgi:hypothetical protein
MDKAFISQHILHQHWYTCPITSPIHQNPQHRSLLTVVSATSAPGRTSFATFKLSWENYLIQLWTALHDKHFMNILCIESFCPYKTHNRTLLFGRTLLKESPSWLLKPASEPRLLRSWIVLLPSDTHREPITSITIVLLPFVTYLLTPLILKTISWCEELPCHKISMYWTHCIMIPPIPWSSM